LILLAAGIAGLAIGLAALTAGCEPTLDRNAPVLLFSTDNQGVLAACGCPSNPRGGFAKRQGLIEQYRRTRPNVLVVDAGDLMPDHPHAVKVKYLAIAAGRARYDAIGLGDQEFAVGVPALQQLAREHQLPFLCANVRDEAGSLVFPPHVIREVPRPTPGAPPWRIGIFSVIADEVYGFPPLEWRKGLKVEPPIDAARREVKELAGCDLVVALSHQSILDTRRLAADVPGIHVIVSGHDPIMLKKPERAGDAVIVSTGEAGCILGALSVGRGADGRPAFRQDLTELTARVPDAQWVMDLYWQYVKESKDKPPPDWNLTPIPERYESAEACRKCHEAEYKAWQKTRHARAYESIKKARRQDDPECILCHTMGYGRPGGFVSMAKTPELGRVTCQACHVVTADHNDKNVKAEPEIYINSRLCMSCHGPVQSPDFDYFVAKPRILHRPPGAGGVR
jgi:hypothetical protein